MRNHIDGYRERMSNPNTPGGGWALSYNSIRYTSLTSRLGAVVANAISTGQGVFVPQFSIDWVHEFENNPRDVRAGFFNDFSAAPLAVRSGKPDRNYFDLGLGISGQFAEGRSAFLNVNTILGYRDVHQYAITGGFRLEF